MRIGVTSLIKMGGVLSTVALLTLTCSEKRVNDENLTKISVISDYIVNDPVGQQALPLVWFDTTSRADIYGTGAAKPISEARTPINPLDYWVEVSRTAREIVLRNPDTCQVDEMTNQPECDEILLSNGARADAEIALLQDTVVCRYYIVDRSDSTVYTKDATYRETNTALIARLDAGSPSFDGWRLYAVGRQRFANAITANRFPAIDSIVIESVDRPAERFAAYPDQNISYDWTGDVLQLRPGELLEVSVYSRSRFGNAPIEDAWLHYESAGVITKEWMGNDISGNPDVQLHQWQIAESSGGQSNEFSQIAVALFQGDAFRDSNPNSFSHLLWAITYQLE